MSFFSWMRNGRSNRAARRRAQHRPEARRFRPQLEALEDRALPSTFYAATASDLIADIKAANLQGGANTIVLTAPTTSYDPYRLTAADNTTDGATVLPVIAKGDALTIQTQNGSWDRIDAWPASHRGGQIYGPGRLFDVAQGASLTLKNLGVENGTEQLYGKGGAIYNQGTLVLSQVLVYGNILAPNYALTLAARSGDAAGGGIWSNGSLTVENSRFQSNSAIGNPMAEGKAFGGAICIVGGTANITGSTFGGQGYSNSAAGGGFGNAYGGAVYVGGGTVTMSGDTVGFYGPFGQPAWGPTNGTAAAHGLGYGGGLCVAGGTVTLRNDSITGNWAATPPGIDPSIWGYGYSGYGGGIFIASAAQVYHDSFTWANTRNNYAGFFGYGPNIYGRSILLPQIGSFTASPNPVTAGTSLALTASNISDGNPSATITQVSFYYLDSSGAQHVLGNGTQTSPGVWTLTVKANLAPGAYTLYAKAEDSSGLFSDPLAFTLTVL